MFKSSFTPTLLIASVGSAVFGWTAVWIVFVVLAVLIELLVRLAEYGNALVVDEDDE